MQSNVAQILPLNLTSPGISGVTGITSMAGDVGDWLFKAQNAVYTKERNIAPRELFFQGPATSYVPIPVTTTYTGSTAGRYFVYGAGAIYDNYGTLLNSLPNGGGTTPVWADNVYWHVCFLNNKYFFFSAGYDPIVFDPFAGPPTFYTIPTAPQVAICHAAFGRVWAASSIANSQTLYWSNLLDGTTWTGAGTGSLNLNTYLNNSEGIKAISDFNGYLLVFTSTDIIILENPFTVPTDSSGAAGTAETLKIKEVIQGTGCVSPVGAVQVGEELFFISKTGLMKMSQVVAAGGSNPITTVINQIATQMNEEIETLSIEYAAISNQVELTYNSDMAMLMCNMNYAKQYLVWLKFPLENGGYPVTTWGDTNENSYAFDRTYICGFYRTGGNLGFGPGATAWIRIFDVDGTTALYEGIGMYGHTEYLYTNYEVCEPLGFTWKITSPWLNFGNQQEFQTKILKRSLIFHRRPRAKFSPSYTAYVPTDLEVNFRIRTDYNPVAYNFTFTATKQEFNPVYTILPDIETQTIPIAGTGGLIQYEMSARITDPAHSYFAVQRLSFQAKLGRIQQGI